jgi:hypothetical protein
MIIYGEVELQNLPRREGLAGWLNGIVDDLGGGGQRNEPVRNDDDADEENIIEVRVMPGDEDMQDDGALVLEVDVRDEDAADDDDEEGEAPPPGLEAFPPAVEHPVQQQPQPQQNDAQHGNRNRQVVPRAAKFSITKTLVKASLALTFPSIAFTCGELLQLVLPRSLTRSAAYSRPGLLHSTWGRSFVGGAMFLVIKDMFQLYVKYRTVVNRSMRRIPSVPRNS